jgi:hypothetical protein
VGKAVPPGLCEDRQLLSLLSLAKIRLSTPSCHGGTILTTPLMRGLSLQQEEGAHALSKHPGFHGQYVLGSFLSD